MDSLVFELQRLAMNPAVPVADVLRTALVVATKLDVSEMREWCAAEIRGYTGRTVPPYRRIEGQLKAWNPALRTFIPVLSRDSAVTRAFATRAVTQSVAELEHLINGSDTEGVLQMPLSVDVLNEYFADSQMYQLGVVPTVLIGQPQLFAVVEGVRNAILDWALKLEKQGILGEGMTFSKSEKGRAGDVTYNIENFTGVVGNVTGDTVQIGNYNSLHVKLKQLGVPQEERNELESVLDALPKASSEDRKSLLTRGTAWLSRNVHRIGTLSDTIRGWFDVLGG